MRRILFWTGIVVASAVAGVMLWTLTGDGDRRLAAVGADTRSYVAGKLFLSSDGQSLGFLKSANCGTVGAEVTRMLPGKGIVDPKQIGPAQYEPCTFTFGLSMDKAIYGWIAEGLVGNAAPKNLTVQSLDFEYKERSLLELVRAHLTEFSMPALDAAVKDVAYMTITVKPESMTVSPGSGAVVKAPVGAKEKVWLPSNFRFEFGKGELKKVSKMSSFRLELAGTEPQRALLGNFTITVPETDLGGFDKLLTQFVVEGQNTQENETTANVTLLDPTLLITLGTLSFTGVGMVSGDFVGTQAGAETIARREYTLYAEGASLTIAP